MEYKARTYSSLGDLMEWVNEGTPDGWTIHTFTHQENDTGLWYVAVLQRSLYQGIDEEDERDS